MTSADFGRPVVERTLSQRTPLQRTPLHRRVWFWIVVGVLLLPALAFGAMVLWFATSDDAFGGGTETVDCAAALEAAELDTLPPGVVASCAEGGFQDPFVTIDFVAPSDDVDAWLREELPATEPQHGGVCPESDGCLQVSYGEPDAPSNGWALDVITSDQGDGTVAVAVMAFSM